MSGMEGSMKTIEYELKRVQSEMDALCVTYPRRLFGNDLKRYWQEIYELSGRKAGLQFALTKLAADPEQKGK